MNKLLVTGRISRINTKDKVTYLGIACRDNFKTDGEYKTQFFGFKVFGETKKIVDQHINIGDLVEAEGDVRINENETDFILKSIDVLIRKSNDKSNLPF